MQAIRVTRGISLRALETLSQVSRSEINNIETGRVVPRLDTAMMLCRALGCGVEDVFQLD